MKTLVTCLLLAVLVALGISGTNAEPTVTSDMKAVVDANNALAVDLFGKLRDNEGNVFFSPFSISAALAMTYAGASGNTSDQMAQTLHFSISGDKLHTAFADLATYLQDLQDKGKVELCVANSLWPQKRYPFSKDYIDLLRRDYDAAVTPVDFINAAKAACLQINKWVEEKTQGKIKEMVPSIYLDTSTRLVLINAIYFKGKWAHQFKKESTKNVQFRMLSGTSDAVPMMTQDGVFGYAEYDNMQLLEMPYAGNELSMLILLPTKPDGIAELQESLTPENLAKWTGKHDVAKVSVTMPRFKITCEFDLKNRLAALGMTDAFDPAKADFSGMDGQKHSLFISAALHKAYVDVNEEGTEAAAATAVVMERKSIPPSPVPFRADHPFLFLIRDNSSGSILFIGRLMDPAK
jgi:serpin B